MAELTESDKLCLNCLFQTLTAKGKGYKIKEVSELVDLKMAENSELIAYESACLLVAQDEDVYRETIQLLSEKTKIFEKDNEESEPIEQPIKKEEKPVKKMAISNEGYEMKAKVGESKDFEKIKAGTHQAVCAGFFGLGVQKTEYKGVEKKLPKVMAIFQTKTTDSKGERFFLTKMYTLSMNDKSNLYADVTSWIGRDLTIEETKEGFDLTTLNGKNCLLTVVHKQVDDKTFVNITGISDVMDEMKLIELDAEVPDGIINKINELREKAIKE